MQSLAKASTSYSSKLKIHNSVKIAIISYYAVTNIGDRILTETLAWLLRQRGHKVVLLDLQARYAYKFSGLCGVIERFMIRAFRWLLYFPDGIPNGYYMRGLRGCDCAVFGGGEIIDPEAVSVNRNISIVVRVAECENIPVYYNSIGVASYSDNIPDELSFALQSKIVRGVSVRESAVRFNQVFLSGSDKKSIGVCDTAVWAAAAYGVRRKESAGNAHVGINVISPVAFEKRGLSYEDVANAYLTIYRKLMANGMDCVLFTNGVRRDDDFAQALSVTIGAGCRIVVPSRIRDGKAFLELLSGFKGIVSSRLHTSICSFSLDVPTVALSWDDKMEYFYQSISARDRCFDLRKKSISDIVSGVAENILCPMPEVDRDSYCQSLFKLPLFKNS